MADLASQSLTIGGEITLTDDGGIVITWERGDREVSIVMPQDRAHCYYVAKKPGERHAGLLTEWAALVDMIAWMEIDAQWSAEGHVEAER